MEHRLVELARRRKAQAPPPWVVWEAISDPLRDGDAGWFRERPGETRPTILEAVKPHRVTWSSIWLDMPELRIEFEIEVAGGGSVVTWILLGMEASIEQGDIRQRGYRLNQLINGDLRAMFG